MIIPQPPASVPQVGNPSTNSLSIVPSELHHLICRYLTEHLLCARLSITWCGYKEMARIGSLLSRHLLFEKDRYVNCKCNSVLYGPSEGCL